MAKPNEKLADALRELKAVQRDGIIQSKSITRASRERLLKAGFLQEITKGWYFTSNPTVPVGSTTWYGNFWAFIRQYLQARFGSKYCLAPDASLLLLSGVTRIPTQLSVISPKGNNRPLELPLGTSLFVYQDPQSFPKDFETIQGLHTMKLGEALVRVGEPFFRNWPSDASISLHMVRDPSEVLTRLLDQGKTVVAGRLAGAFRHIGKPQFADRIITTMKDASYDVRESNPFDRPLPTLSIHRSSSPYEIRIRAMWAEMRPKIIEVFPKSPGLPNDASGYLKSVDDIYTQDAYNSLSIEGYSVSDQLIERVSKGNWNPDQNQEDRKSGDALAARGYFEAFQTVKTTVSEIIRGAPLVIVREAHHSWHRALFNPSVQAGLLQPSDLAGYRNNPVIINGSRHVPLPDAALMDAMSALFDLIENEPEASVRAVLGHFVFVFIHPYTDGNGRLGRFLMNTMLASGGYPWTIIHLEGRKEYMASLENASVGLDIDPFARFVSNELKNRTQVLGQG